MALFDIVGLGALNRDYIKPVESAPTGSRTDSQGPGDFVADTEYTLGNQDAFAAVVARHGNDPADESRFGGSAFNTIVAANCLGLGLRLAYVSVLGPPLLKGGSMRWPDLEEPPEHAGIDFNGVVASSAPTGVCLSLVDRNTGKRELHTFSSDAVAVGLRDPHHREVLLRPLINARHIHVTSVLGEEGPRAVLEVLDEALSKSTVNPTVSVDPGMPWAKRFQEDDDIKTILALSRYVFANVEELEEMTGIRDDVELAAASFVRTLDSAATTVIFKEPHRAHVTGTVGLSANDVPQVPLPRASIADSTGAGDVFAAGFLAATLSQRGQDIGSTFVGLASARARMAGFGSAGFRLLRDTFTPEPTETAGVFVCHAAADGNLADEFSRLLESTGVAPERIFCTSVKGSDIQPGAKWRQEIRKRLASSSLFVSLVTPAFLESEFCAYETGAAWILGLDPWSLVHDVDLKHLGALRSEFQAAELRDGAALRQVRNELVTLRVARAPREEVWERNLHRFLRAVPD